MVIINRSQIQAFETAARSHFENQMVAHARMFSPRLHQVIGGAQMREAIRQGINNAFKYGFTRRGPVQFYIDMMLLFGSSVGDDPQYPWAIELLRTGDGADQMARAERLHHEVLKYLENVHGPNNDYVYQALRRLCDLSTENIYFGNGKLEDNLLRFLEVVHPEKYAQTKRGALVLLIEEAAKKTREYTEEDDVRHIGLMTALMFSFGHGCDLDPLYPWIKKTLGQQPRSSSIGKMKVLERQSRLWMKAVLKNESDVMHDQST